MAGTNQSTTQYCTDVQYMTKNEMRRFLKTNLIDFQWNETLGYRKKNAVFLDLRDINNRPLSLTKTQAINEKVERCFDLINELQEKVEEISQDKDIYSTAKKQIYSSFLRKACAYENVALSESYLTVMFTDVYQCSDPKEQPIKGYLDLLNELESNPGSALDEDYLAHLLETLEGTDELTSFYRESDRKNRYAVTAYETYDCCPVALIESKVSSLFDNVRYGKLLSTPLKALLLVYYIDYLKPFDAHNELIASYLGKAYLAQNGMAKGASFLPFEELLTPNDRLADVCKSVQLDHDFTYFVCYAVERLAPMLENVAHELSLIYARHLQEEQHRLGAAEAQAAKKEEPIEETSPEDMPIPVEPIVPKKEVKPKKESDVPLVTEEEMRNVSSGVAIFTPRPALSDKEAKEVARYILETHPNIRKAQANFYATHCTIGRYYTIQDYKKATRCVYETARTSMDNMAKEGFYKKLQFKNKFVYSPIKQGEKQ